MQKLWTDNQAWLSPVITLVVSGILSAIARNVPSNAWWLAAIRLVLQSGNSLDNHMRDETKKAVKEMNISSGAIVFLALLLGGCGGTLHDTIDTLLIYQGEAHTEQAEILAAANAAIATLPLDQQAKAFADVASANSKLSASLTAKDATLKAAQAASDPSGINIQQIEADIEAAVNAVVALVEAFGVVAQTERAHVAAAHLLAAHTPVVHK
jgi:hypothetical protein